jgi:hypothetical protein
MRRHTVVLLMWRASSSGPWTTCGRRRQPKQACAADVSLSFARLGVFETAPRDLSEDYSSDKSIVVYGFSGLC